MLAESPAKAAVLDALVPAGDVRAGDRVHPEHRRGRRRGRPSASPRGAGDGDPLRARAPPATLDVCRASHPARLRVLTAPQVLDEGVDVPAADLGVILAASRSRRQMIQRMGRVLRRKPDGSVARFVIAFAVGTVEDPSLGAHAGFLDEITPVADAVRTFAPGDPIDIA